MSPLLRRRRLDDLADAVGGPPPRRWRVWFAGARLRTVPVSVAPVLVGVAAAARGETVVWWRAGAALVVSVAIQVGTNYANDYSDGRRGTDSQRVGPVRLVATGLAPPRSVLTASLASFAVAAVVGAVLAVSVSPWLLLIGAACLAAGWTYVGGPLPYGYHGLGEVFAFAFFGPVAVLGSGYVATRSLPAVGWVASVGVGALAVALLVANNLRDAEGDARSGKRTLAVRLGPAPTRGLFAAAALAPFPVAGVLAVAGRPWALLTLGALPVALPVVRRVLGGQTGRALVSSLLDTARIQLAVGVLLAVGLLA